VKKRDYLCFDAGTKSNNRVPTGHRDHFPLQKKGDSESHKAVTVVERESNLLYSFSNLIIRDSSSKSKVSAVQDNPFHLIQKKKRI